MPDYSNGKIYKITSSNTDLIYIGSTTQSLSVRKSDHVRRFRKFQEDSKIDTVSHKIFSFGGSIDICLVENYPCENKEQLHARERYFIENLTCVNKQRPGRTQKEYKEQHKEKIDEYQKNYKIINKVKIALVDKEYCEKNKEVIKEKKKDYRLKNKDIIKEKHKIWRENNKDKLKKYRVNRKSIKNITI